MVELSFIDKGKPTQNAFVESFNGKFRDECLNEEWFLNLMDARVKIASWRNEYNSERPHSGLGDIPPCEFSGEQPEVFPHWRVQKMGCTSRVFFFESRNGVNYE